MAVAAEPRGLKRICPSCGTRYYDFNKRPVNCPSCKTEFVVELKLKGRRGRASVVANDAVSKSVAVPLGAAPSASEEELGVERLDIVSLEDVESLEEGAGKDEDLDTADPDLDIEDEDIGSLEEELEEDVAEDPKAKG